MRKGITASGIAAAVSIALLGGTGQAFADSHATAAPAKLTVAEYKSWLNRTPGASVTLKAFNRLTPAKQKAFVGYLQNAKVYKAFTAAQDGDIPGRAMKPTRYNNDVTFTSSTTATARRAGNSTVISLSVTAAERIFNIPVTTVSTQLTYETDRRHLITGRGEKVSHKGTNFNAAFAIKPSASRIGPEANMLDGTTTWTATPKYTSAGTKHIKKLQVVTGLGDHGWHSELINLAS
ncbi:hypothetical protein [Streptomyces sp. HUAS TT20]|uniref:hypothetical protein n=1 Tax=Streptomyces sp. HUAS TT20 TaxID=3447509 RepID=UPI0021DA4803|nr:hypothetical protein [Streptomyces sp. HUAS 15-9]UXY25219.1 hypothetical protein N8I87_00605 [Streptomyces sp. HUAS 15-9]